MSDRHTQLTAQQGPLLVEDRAESYAGISAAELERLAAVVNRVELGDTPSSAGRRRDVPAA